MSGLCDPPKEMVWAVDAGQDVVVDRRLRLVLLQGPEADVVEVIVSVTRGEIDRWEIVRDVRPPLQMEESILVLAALHEHPEWNAALDRRGIVDRSLVQIDPWPAGTFGLGHEEGRRITRCLAYLRESKEDNGYARPLEGLLAFVDMGRGEVLEVRRPRSRAVSARARELLPRAQRAPAHRPQAAGDRPARGAELRGGRESRALAEMVVPHRHGPAGGPGAVDGRLRGRRAGSVPSSTGPR